MEDRNKPEAFIVASAVGLLGHSRAALADDATTKEKACCRWVVHVTFVSMSVSVSAARTLAYFSSHSQTQTIGQLDPCISFSTGDRHCLHYSVRVDTSHVMIRDLLIRPNYTSSIKTRPPWNSICYRNVGVMRPSFFADFKVTRCTSDKVQTRILKTTDIGCWLMVRDLWTTKRRRRQIMCAVQREYAWTLHRCCILYTKEEEEEDKKDTIIDTNQ